LIQKDEKNSNKPCSYYITTRDKLKKNIAQQQKVNTVKKKILFVVTSHDKKGNTGEPTGYYLSEVSHPWDVLRQAGYEIDFVSPLGGKAPVDGFDLSDSVNAAFWNNPVSNSRINNSLKPSEVRVEEYDAIFYAGGHGAMWDLPVNKELASIAAAIYEKGGIVSAVCHGPAGLLTIRLSDGAYLISGKKINAFTNEEEINVGMEKTVPFLLEDQLKNRGAKFEKSVPWQQHVTIDGRLITGQNPQSAKAVGENLVKVLSERQ
jgi:putative intracellular protease/amidase